MAELKSLIVNGVTRLNNTGYAKQLYAEGVHHTAKDDDNYVLLAGGSCRSLDSLSNTHTHDEYVLKSNTCVSTGYGRINGDIISRVNDADYATYSGYLNNHSVSNPSAAYLDQKVKWFARINGNAGFAGTNAGFHAVNNANGILWLGTHDSKYGGQLGISSDGEMYYRYISGGYFPATADGESWNKLVTTHTYIMANNTNVYYQIGKLPSTAVTGDGEAEVVFSLYNAIGFGNNFPAKWLVVASSRKTYNLVATKITGVDHIEIKYTVSGDYMEIWVSSKSDIKYMGRLAVEIHTATNFTKTLTKQLTVPNGWTSTTTFIDATKRIALDNSNISPSLRTSGNNIAVIAGGVTSSYITVPYATSASNSNALGGYLESSFFRYRGEIETSYIDLSVYTSGAAGYKNPGNGIWKATKSNESVGLITFTGGGSASGLDIYFHYAKGRDFKFRRRIDSNRVSGAWEVILTDQNYTNYLTHLDNQIVSDSSSAYLDQKVKWFAQINSTRNGGEGYAGTTVGFHVANNANGILWLGTHGGKYGGQLGISSDGEMYYRYISNGSFPTTAEGGSWKKILNTSNTYVSNEVGYINKLEIKKARKIYLTSETGTFSSNYRELKIVSAHPGNSASANTIYFVV